MAAREPTEASLLILSRAIYARKSGDAFYYPGSVETKTQNGSYLVKFTDGSRKRVDERDITWIGFWGLPADSWPRNPIVYTAGPANMEFLDELARNHNARPNSAFSFKTPFREENNCGKPWPKDGFVKRDVNLFLETGRSKTEYARSEWHSKVNTLEREANDCSKTVEEENGKCVTETGVRHEDTKHGEAILLHDENVGGKTMNRFAKEAPLRTDLPTHPNAEAVDIALSRHELQRMKLKQASSHERLLKTLPTDNHKRISVIRMCSREGPLREERQHDGASKEKRSLNSTKDELGSPDFKLSPKAPFPQDEDKKHFTFDEDFKPLSVKNDISGKKRKISTSEHDACSMKDKYHRPNNVEKKLQHSPAFQKQHLSSLPPFASSNYHDNARRLDISIYDPPPSPIPASIRLQTRAKTRTENKKCRKVYGIENRDIWCTQCKWKKACTRFANIDKREWPKLMYIPEYEGFQYLA